MRINARLTPMRTFWRKHLQRILAAHSAAVFVCMLGIGLTLTFQGQTFVSMLAAATSSLSSAPSIAYFIPYDDTPLAVGETTEIDIDVNTKVPINAIGATIKFPADSLEVVGISKEKSFLDLWTEDTIIKEDSGEVHFSGGTTAHGGLKGMGVALTLSVRAKRAGLAKIYFEDVQLYAHDGKGTILETDKHTFTFDIPGIERSIASSPPTGGSSAYVPPSPPNADFNDDGKVTLADLSILSIRMTMSYNARYDLDVDGTIGLSDVSILLSRMKQ